jgi:hypothetical protein
VQVMEITRGIVPHEPAPGGREGRLERAIN